MREHTYGRRSYVGRTSRDERGFWIFGARTIETIGNQLIASCIIGLAIIIISNFSGSFAGDIVGRIRWTVTEDYNFKNEAAGLWNDARPAIAKKFDELYGFVAGAFGGGKSQKSYSDSAESMIMPVDGEVTSTFGPRKDSATGETVQHTGIDIAASEGTPISAALDGTIAETGESGSMGKYVKIDHGAGLQTVYEHCSEILFQKDQQVKKGDTIAKVGKTGDADGAHLHFEVIRDGKQVDPLGIISDAANGRA